jgi:dihydroorotase-like cyclic amidohydrolase
VQEANLRSRSKNSPLEDCSMEGRVMETVIAGRSVFTQAR